MEHTTNRIGIEKSVAEAIATRLTELLAEYNVFANNVRGPQFISLRSLFDKIYREVIDKIVNDLQL